MIEIPVTVRDLSQLRFAWSPLWEVVASLRVLQAPARHAVHLPWVEQARPALADLVVDPVWPLALALVPPTGYLADFLTPPPTTPLPDLADELATVAATPARVVRGDLARLRADTCAEPVPRTSTRPGAADAAEVMAAALDGLAEHPRATLRRLVALLAAYDERVIAPHRPRLRALLDADIAVRSQRLARGGVPELFRDLHPAVRWEGDGVTVQKAYGARVDPGGRGLVLVPCAFAWPSVLVMSEPPWQPTLIYPARGVGTLWEAGRGAPDGLAAALGRTRADLLVALSGPASTSELARRLAVTAGAVSQHVAVLRAAGLTTTERTGRSAVHARTPLADQLVSAAAP